LAAHFMIDPILISTIATWVASNYDKIPVIAKRTSEFFADVAEKGAFDKTVRAIGNNIIWNRPDGASYMLGMLDQMDTSIDALEVTQQGTLSGLSGLKTLSMVPLGFSGVTVELIAAQFMFLERSLSKIRAEIERLGIKLDQTMEASLESGQDFLEQAATSPPDAQREHYNKALERARDAGSYFCLQACNPQMHKNDLRIMQYYSRKYFLALSIELASLIGIAETHQIQKRLSNEEANLKKIAAQTYARTVADRVPDYLRPENASFASLASLSELVQSARDLGCITAEHEITPETVFETNRKRIFSFSYKPFVPHLRGELHKAAFRLHAAQSTLAEVTRLLSWRDSTKYI